MTLRNLLLVCLLTNLVLWVFAYRLWSTGETEDGEIKVSKENTPEKGFSENPSFGEVK